MRSPADLEIITEALIALDYHQERTGEWRDLACRAADNDPPHAIPPAQASRDNLDRAIPMPVEFLTDDEAAAFRRFAGPPSQADLERVFFLDRFPGAAAYDENRRQLAASRVGREQVLPELVCRSDAGAPAEPDRAVPAPVNTLRGPERAGMLGRPSGGERCLD